VNPVLHYHTLIALAAERHNQLLLEAQNERLVQEALQYAAQQAEQSPRQLAARPGLRQILRRFLARPEELAAG
jgi:hypothetical protein